MLETGIVERASLAPGARVSGPAVIVERETSTVVTSPFDAVMQDDGSILLLAQGHRRMSDTIERNPHAGHVEPSDLGRRGAGHDAAAHRLLDLGARSRRPFRRRLRSAGPNAGAGGDRHAGPREHDGGSRAALHGRDPARRHVPRRHLRHQRSLEGHRASARHHHGVALLPGRRDWSPSSPARLMSSTSAGAASARTASPSTRKASRSRS